MQRREKLSKLDIYHVIKHRDEYRTDIGNIKKTGFRVTRNRRKNTVGKTGECKH